ncbi:MAG TPA: hypothetical protein VLH08_03590 [Acidobacteriota bacterium]|nr:hypothetical protein [Acidobacteriota bacterium]
MIPPGIHAEFNELNVNIDLRERRKKIGISNPPGKTGDAFDQLSLWLSDFIRTAQLALYQSVVTSA